ncbi:hypothetical protein CVS40_12310 [Lucilia cuprina]|nr:hypothetical protein CVS40_12310 [Lucilia cuprina]
MKIFQIIFVVACVIAAVSCNPGNNEIGGNGNVNNQQSNGDGRFCAFVIAVVSCNPGNNAMDGNGNAMNKQTISDGRFCAVCGN